MHSFVLNKAIKVVFNDKIIDRKCHIIGYFVRFTYYSDSQQENLKVWCCVGCNYRIRANSLQSIVDRYKN